MKGFVYLLNGGGFTKIGKTTRTPEERTAEYSPKLPFPASIVHVIKCRDVDFTERLMHSSFKSLHLRGEWFDIDEPDLEYIKSGAYDDLGEITEKEAWSTSEHYRKMGL